MFGYLILVKHLEVRKNYSAVSRTLNSLLRVWCLIYYRQANMCEAKLSPPKMKQNVKYLSNECFICMKITSCVKRFCTKLAFKFELLCLILNSLLYFRYILT